MQKSDRLLTADDSERFSCGQIFLDHKHVAASAHSQVSLVTQSERK